MRGFHSEEYAGRSAFLATIKVLDWLHRQGNEDLENGALEAARSRFQKILQITREADWVERANAGLAEVYLEDDNLFWAMDHVRRAIKRAPNHPHYRYLKASIHLKRGEPREAANEGIRAVEDELECADYYHLLGRAVYRCEGYAPARRFLDWALQCDPDDLEVRLDYARMEIEQGHFQRALSILKEALDAHAEDERVRKNIRAIQENWEITGS